MNKQNFREITSSCSTNPKILIISHLHLVVTNFGEMPTSWHLQRRRFQAWWIINRALRHHLLVPNVFCNPPKIRFISVVAIENRCYQFNARDVVAFMNKCILRKFASVSITRTHLHWNKCVCAKLNSAIYSFLRQKHSRRALWRY